MKVIYHGPYLEGVAIPELGFAVERGEVFDVDDVDVFVRMCEQDANYIPGDDESADFLAEFCLLVEDDLTAKAAAAEEAAERVRLGLASEYVPPPEIPNPTADRIAELRAKRADRHAVRSAVVREIGPTATGLGELNMAVGQLVEHADELGLTGAADVGDGDEPPPDDQVPALVPGDDPKPPKPSQARARRDRDKDGA